MMLYRRQNWSKWWAPALYVWRVEGATLVYYYYYYYYYYSFSVRNNSYKADNCKDDGVYLY